MRLPAALLLALAASNFAWSDAAHPPARVAHLSYVEGELRFQGEETPATTALPDRPLRAGDRLRTARDGRAELALGTATIRLDEESELSVRRLDEKHTRIELAAGAAVVHLREFYEQEEFEIRAGNADIALLEPGEYRVDVSARDATAITVRTGAAEVESAVGPVRVAAGQRVSLDVRDGIARLESPPGADAFDDWVLERELQLADAEPPRYTPAEDGGYQELDRYGEWYDEPRYGRVWMPSYYYGGLSPYRHGYWHHAGYGWSWINPAPWGFFTFHSGRWAYLHHLDRWCWVPSSRFRHRHFNDWQDPRPYGRPRGFPRDRPQREDGPRTAGRPSNSDDVRARIVTNALEARRNEAERRPAPQREATSGRSRIAANIARAVNRERSASAPAAAPAPTPAAAAPRNEGARARNESARVRPSRDSGARERPVRESAPTMRREPGTRQEH